MSDKVFDPAAYEAFLASKRFAAPSVGIEARELSTALFPHQVDITRWALAKGRAAVWADCGLGKSLIALEWARQVREHTGAPVLILTPLAVARQFVREGEKFGIAVTNCREAGDMTAGLNVTNYERLDRFDVSGLGGVVIDESSILKDFTGKTRNQLIELFARTPFKLAQSATPAPNDFVELGNHAEFLGVMNRTEMLAMFFTHDGGSTQDWRLKGHARQAFWRWVSSWATAVRQPSDLGYSDAGFDLPPLNIHQHVVDAGAGFAREQGTLFAVEARTLTEQRNARRHTLGARVQKAAEIVAAEPKESWLVFCDLNDESKALAAALPEAVEVTGSDSSEDKEERMFGFADGSVKTLVSKASICGHGMNFQRCARVMFVGVSHSFEEWYQAIRRVYRFGQKRPVDCHVITSSADGAVVANLRRKQTEATEMMAALVHEMDIGSIRKSCRESLVYQPTKAMVVPSWIGTEA